MQFQYPSWKWHTTLTLGWLQRTVSSLISLSPFASKRLDSIFLICTFDIWIRNSLCCNTAGYLRYHIYIYVCINARCLSFIEQEDKLNISSPRIEHRIYDIDCLVALCFFLFILFWIFFVYTALLQFLKPYCYCVKFHNLLPQFFA